VRSDILYLSQFRVVVAHHPHASSHHIFMPFCIGLTRWHADCTALESTAFEGEFLAGWIAALSAVGTYAASCFMPHGWQYARFSRNIWISNAV
jgi:hypothetical protein